MRYQSIMRNIACLFRVFAQSAEQLPLDYSGAYAPTDLI